MKGTDCRTCWTWEYYFSFVSHWWLGVRGESGWCQICSGNLPMIHRMCCLQASSRGRFNQGLAHTHLNDGSRASRGKDHSSTLHPKPAYLLETDPKHLHSLLWAEMHSPHNLTCWSPTTSECDVFGDRALQEVIKLKSGHWDEPSPKQTGLLIWRVNSGAQRDARGAHTHSLRGYSKKAAVYKPRGSQQLTPWPWASCLQNCENPVSVV